MPIVNLPLLIVTIIAILLFLSFLMSLRMIRNLRLQNNQYLKALEKQDDSLWDSMNHLKKINGAAEESVKEIYSLEQKIHSILPQDQINSTQKELSEMSDAVFELIQGQKTLIYRAITSSSAEATTSMIITDLINFVEEINSKSKVVHDIAFKTKVLSFNASVEAERAGARGRGFSIVAQEMKRLAEISGKAAEEIGSLVERTRRGTQLLASGDSSPDGSMQNTLMEANANMEKLQEKVNELKERTSSMAHYHALSQQNLQEVTQLIQHLSQAQEKLKHLNEDLLKSQDVWAS